MQIRLDVAPFYATQDVAVSVAFLITEIVEFGMLCGAGLVSVALEADGPGGARLSVEVDALAGAIDCDEALADRFERIVTGLARQLRSALDRDPGAAATRSASQSSAARRPRGAEPGSDHREVARPPARGRLRAWRTGSRRRRRCRRHRRGARRWRCCRDAVVGIGGGGAGDEGVGGERAGGEAGEDRIVERDLVDRRPGSRRCGRHCRRRARW